MMYRRRAGTINRFVHATTSFEPIVTCHLTRAPTRRLASAFACKWRQSRNHYGTRRVGLAGHVVVGMYDPNLVNILLSGGGGGGGSGGDGGGGFGGEPAAAEVAVMVVTTAPAFFGRL